MHATPWGRRVHASRQKMAAKPTIEKVVKVRKAPYDPTADDLAY